MDTRQIIESYVDDVAARLPARQRNDIGLELRSLLAEQLQHAAESAGFALWACFVCLLYWALFGWDIFANPLTDALFKAWLLVFLLVNTIQMVLWIRRARVRVRTPAALLDRGSRA